MPDRDQHYWKYRVFREPATTGEIEHPVPIKAEYLDNEDGDWEEWADLEEVDGTFFVLRPENDHHARVAMAAYAYSCRQEFPRLASDIIQMIEELEWEEDSDPGSNISERSGEDNPKADGSSKSSGTSDGNVVEINRSKRE